MTTAKVLKDRRSPRERGRMGSSLTGSIVNANLLNRFTVISASAIVDATPAGRFSVTSSMTWSPYSAYPALPMTRHVSPTMTYVFIGSRVNVHTSERRGGVVRRQSSES